MTLLTSIGSRRRVLQVVVRGSHIMIKFKIYSVQRMICTASNPTLAAQQDRRTNSWELKPMRWVIESHLKAALTCTRWLTKRRMSSSSDKASHCRMAWANLVMRTSVTQTQSRSVSCKVGQPEIYCRRLPAVGEQRARASAVLVPSGRRLRGTKRRCSSHPSQALTEARRRSTMNRKCRSPQSKMLMRRSLPLPWQRRQFLSKSANLRPNI